MKFRFRGAALVLVCGASFSSCSEQESLASKLKPPTSSTPQPDPTPPPAPGPSIRALQLSGNLVLTAVGQTSQLKITALYTDDSSQDVTSLVRWTVSNTKVATVTQDGLVTVTELGATFLHAGSLG